MRPSFTQGEWQEAFESCAIQAGFVGEITFEADGGISFVGEETEHNDELLDQCSAQVNESFAEARTQDDPRLQLVAQYELAKRAAACVEEQLGLDAKLPSLEAYIDSNGLWNVYTAAIEASPVKPPAQWDEWQSACPQDLRHYIDS